MRRRHQLFVTGLAFSVSLLAGGAFAQTPWTVTLTPTMNPLPAGFCAAIQLTVLDPAVRDVPRNPLGFRVTMADFDISITGSAVVAHQIDASHWESCACQSAAAGSTATVIARYPSQALAANARVPGVTVQQTASFSIAPPKGAVNPPACVAIGTAGGAAAAAGGAGAQAGAGGAAGPAGSSTAAGGASTAAGGQAGAGVSGAAGAGAQAGAGAKAGAAGAAAGPAGSSTAGTTTAGTTTAGTTTAGTTTAGGASAAAGGQAGAGASGAAGAGASGAGAQAGAGGAAAGPAASSSAGTAPPVGVALPATLPVAVAPPVATAPSAPPATAPSAPAPPPAAAPPATPVVSGRYLVSVTGLRAYQMSVDDILSRDGRGDEVYAAAFVRRYDRRTGQLLEYPIRQTVTYGDVTNFIQRVQAGTSSGTGGVQDGDPIPAGPLVASRTMPAQDTMFPWRLWEGTLTDNADALIISPSVWEQDTNSSLHSLWVQQQLALNSTVFSYQSVQAQITQRAFGTLVSSASGFGGGGLLGTQLKAASDLALAHVGTSLVSLLSSSNARPIGLLANGASNAMLPNQLVVLTREIIEAALAQPALGNIPSPVANVAAGIQNQATAALAKIGVAAPRPGILVVQFEDRNMPGMLLFPERPAIYQMFIQVERIP